MWYSIFKENNKIKITNQGIKEIQIKIFEDSSEISNSFLDLEKQIEITIPQKEGLYRLVIFNEDNTVEYLIPNYSELLKDVIKSIKNFLCQGNSVCNTCNKFESGSKEECEILKETLFKIFFYYMLMGQYYQPYFNRLSESLKEDFRKDYSCMTMQEMITGKANDIIFIKKFISLMYLTFFQAEKDLGININTKELEEKYEYNTIKSCLIGVSDFFLDKLCEEHRGVLKIGKASLGLDNLQVFTFTQKHFKDLLTPQYFHSKMDALESIKIGSVKEGDMCRFRFKNELLEEGQIITMDEIGKGFLKFYPQPNKLEYKVKSYFTFSVKTKTSNIHSNLSKYLIIT